MTNVSKRPLKTKVAAKISEQLILLFADLDKFKESSFFINDFFTESEKIMFTKRLAIIFLVLEDVPQVVIADSLKVSQATIRKIARILDRGGYQFLRKYFADKKNKEKIWYHLKIILQFGQPRLVGKGRWSSLNSRGWKKVEERLKI